MDTSAYNLKSFLIILTICYSFSYITVFAANTKYIPNGYPVTISWSVADADACTASTDYPNTGDGVYATWVSTYKSSAGSAFLGYPTSGGAYSFSCSSNNPPGASDTSVLVVGRVWGGNVPQPADCSIPAGGSSCQITYSWTSYGLNSPDFTGCGYTGTHWGGSCSIGYPYDYNENGSITYNVNPNGIYVRIAGTPDYLSYQGVHGINSLGVCIGGSVWNGTTCGCTVTQVVSSGNCVELNPNVTSTANIKSGVSPVVTWSSTIPTSGPAVQCEISRTLYLNSNNSDAWQVDNTTVTAVSGNGSNSPEIFTTIAPQAKYVWYKIRCWAFGDGSGGQSTGWVSASNRTTIGHARLWFNP